MILNRVKKNFVNTGIPVLLVWSALSCRGKGKWSSDPRVGCFLRVMQHIFNETAMQARTRASQCLAKKSWSMSEPSSQAREKGQDNQGEIKGLSK